MKLIIYIPAYNEAESIQKVLASLPRELDQVDNIHYLVVDDGSNDRTAALAQQSGAQVVTHSRNRGVGAAFHTAVNQALQLDADMLVGIDADGQFNPDEIRYMIQPIMSGAADMVVGNRFADGIPEYMPRTRYLGNKIVARIISSLSGQTFQDVSCGFRVYNREALLRLNVFGQFTYTHEVILSLIFQGLNVVEHAIQVKYDPARVSRVARSIMNYTLQTSKIILRVLLDYRPLQVFGSLAGILISIGILLEAILFGYYFIFGRFTPYKNLGFIGLGFFTFGMLVLIIALIADMLNRIRINQDKLLYELKKSRYEK